MRVPVWVCAFLKSNWKKEYFSCSVKKNKDLQYLSTNVISICLRMLFPFVYEYYFHLSTNVISTLSTNVISICLRVLFPFVYECCFHLSYECCFQLSTNVISICLRMLFPFVYECYFHLSTNEAPSKVKEPKEISKNRHQKKNVKIVLPLHWYNTKIFAPLVTVML